MLTTTSVLLLYSLGPLLLGVTILAVRLERERQGAAGSPRDRVDLGPLWNAIDSLEQRLAHLEGGDEVDFDAEASTTACELPAGHGLDRSEIERLEQALDASHSDLRSEVDGLRSALAAVETGSLAESLEDLDDRLAALVPAHAQLAEQVEALGSTPPAAAHDREDLQLIRGIGPALERSLHGLGVHTLAQIAAMDEAQLVQLGEELGSFGKRVLRDDWAGQARALTS